MEQIVSGVGYPTRVTRCRGALGCGDLQGHLRQDEHSSRDRLRAPSDRNGRFGYGCSRVERDEHKGIRGCCLGAWAEKGKDEAMKICVLK